MEHDTFYVRQPGDAELQDQTDRWRHLRLPQLLRPRETLATGELTGGLTGYCAVKISPTAFVSCTLSVLTASNVNFKTRKLGATMYLNPLTAGPDYIRFLHF